MLVWLSFADPHKPRGQTFIGVVVVQLPDTFKNRPQETVEAAMEKAEELGVLPDMHGCIDLEGAGLKDEAVPPQFWNRLLSSGDITINDLGYNSRTTH